MHRKPPAKAQARRETGFPLPAVRRAIWQQATELVITGDVRDVTGVLANRFTVSKRAVMLALVAEGMRHERRAAALHSGISNALAMAKEAEDAVGQDLAEAQVTGAA